MKTTTCGSACGWAISLLLALLIAHPAAAAGAEWVGTWGAAPEPPSPALGPIPGSPSFSDQTVREWVRISAGGERLRIRFTNEYGTKPLVIGAAQVALTDAQGAVEAGTARPILFGGRSSAVIPAGSPFVSDAVDLPAKPFATLSISIYLPQSTGPCTCHGLGMQMAYVSGSGDFVGKPFVPVRTMQARAFISRIDVESARPAKTIVVVGDSISDGVGSTLNANRRWPDLLAERLARRRGRYAWGVVNMGISGNRVLDDGMGQSALARFDRDALSVPGVSYVIIFEGVNDLGISYGRMAAGGAMAKAANGAVAKYFAALVPAHKATAQALIEGYRQLIERAHEAGIKVIGATITPYGGATYYSPEGEAQREAINHWIRTGGAFDGVLDFDAALRDPAKPTQIATALQAGDHLHGSDAGYEALARSVNLALFK